MILPIYIDQIPYRFESDFNGIIYTFEIHFNSEGEFFTIDLMHNEEVIVYGEKVVYGQQLFQSLNNEKLPKLIPLDPSNQENKVTFDNFSKTVLLQVIDDAI